MIERLVWFFIMWDWTIMNTILSVMILKIVRGKSGKI